MWHMTVDKSPAYRITRRRGEMPGSAGIGALSVSFSDPNGTGWLVQEVGCLEAGPEADRPRALAVA